MKTQPKAPVHSLSFSSPHLLVPLPPPPCSHPTPTTPASTRNSDEQPSPAPRLHLLAQDPLGQTLLRPSARPPASPSQTRRPHRRPSLPSATPVSRATSLTASSALPSPPSLPSSPTPPRTSPTTSDQRLHPRRPSSKPSSHPSTTLAERQHHSDAEPPPRSPRPAQPQAPSAGHLLTRLPHLRSDPSNQTKPHPPLRHHLLSSPTNLSSRCHLLLAEPAAPHRRPTPRQPPTSTTHKLHLRAATRTTRCPVDPFDVDSIQPHPPEIPSRCPLAPPPVIEPW